MSCTVERGLAWECRKKNPSSLAKQLDTPATEAGCYYNISGRVVGYRLKTDKIVEGKPSEGSDERIERMTLRQAEIY